MGGRFSRPLAVALLAILLLAACQGRPGGRPAVTVDRTSSLIDQPLAITISGLRPHQAVTVRAEATHHTGDAWESSAEFVADGRGRVDLARMAPRSGSYSRADAMGLLWSLRPLEKEAPTSPFDWYIQDPIPVTLVAEVGGRPVATVELQRLMRTDQVVRRPIRSGRLVGALYAPRPPRPRPTVLVLNGIGGGSPDGPAALLASHGYTAMALSFVGDRGLPDKVSRVPLEYVAKGIAWLKAQPEADARRVVLLGWSRGAELALLVAANYPAEVSGVIGISPSAVVNPASRADSSIDTPTSAPAPSWMLHGKPLPFMPVDPSKVRHNGDGSISPVAAFERSLADRAAVARARIPVERINGPVLLVSGTDDQLWPSSRYGDLMVSWLRDHHHSFSVQHLKYPGAGHLLNAPYFPTNWVQHPNGWRFGGSAAANARADADAWPKILAFIAGQ